MERDLVVNKGGRPKGTPNTVGTKVKRLPMALKERQFKSSDDTKVYRNSWCYRCNAPHVWKKPCKTGKGTE
jgi:hypothetical protein